jgi:hypothetical protein
VWHIDFVPSAGSEMFTLTCATCKMKRSFHNRDLTPYVVSPRCYAKGYAERDEYSARQDLADVALRKSGLLSVTVRSHSLSRYSSGTSSSGTREPTFVSFVDLKVFVHSKPLEQISPACAS